MKTIKTTAKNIKNYTKTRQISLKIRKAEKEKHNYYIAPNSMRGFFNYTI